MGEEIWILPRLPKWRVALGHAVARRTLLTLVL
jgi:hypothetical protein